MSIKASSYLVSKAIAGIPVTIALDAAGGFCGVSEVVLEIGRIFGQLPTPARDGYRFMGWFIGGEWVSPKRIVTGDVTTLVAKWAEVESEDAL